MDNNEICKKKAYFPTNLAYLFFTHEQKPKFGPFLRIYFDLSLSLSFFLSFPSLLVVLSRTLSSFFCMELWLANFLGKGQT